MPIYYSQIGNPEIWADKPTGYYTVEEWTTAHPSPAPEIPTTDELFSTLRTSRDAKLLATDKYLLPDYPIAADALEQVKAYRAALRALPEQPGAPWPGGGIPWPVMPQI